MKMRLQLLRETKGRYRWCRSAGVRRRRSLRHAIFVYKYDKERAS